MSHWDSDRIPGGSRNPVPPRWPVRRVQQSLVAWLLLAPLIGLWLLGGWLARQFAPPPPALGLPPVVAVPPAATPGPPPPSPTWWWRLDYAVPTVLPLESK